MTNILGIDHIAIAVENLDEAAELWGTKMGMRLGSREIVREQGVEIQMVYAGDTRIELVCPIDSESPVAKFIDKRGCGIHHLALAVDDCQAAIDDLAAQSVKMIDHNARDGAHDTSIAFVHPSSTGGVLTELVAGGEGFNHDK
ncbi:MAG: methylmalonyl-CoA epimerase [Planctomycetota bacterium]|jgi:methylmalonyl-CoA/ethylmalonyl-CoA epimerase|nr:methylmalonyl-CoA epimerase [Planctomycetota bacterium]